MVETDPEILKRLDSIESMLRRILYNSSPASLAVEEKARLVAKAIPHGKAAVREVMRQINGGK